MGIFDKITETVSDAVNSVGDEFSKVSEKVDSVLKDIGGGTADFLKERAHNLGIYKSLDKVWKKYGTPIFKITLNIENKIKDQFKKIPYIDNIITLAKLHPLINDIFKIEETRNKALNSLASGNVKEFLEIMAVEGVDLYIFMETGISPHEIIKYNNDLKKLDLKKDINKYNREINNLINDFRKSGRILTRKEASERLDKWLN